MNFAENLKNERLKRNLSQKEVSEIIHISQQQISKYESGKLQPSIEMLIQLANFYDISIDKLVGRSYQ